MGGGSPERVSTPAGAVFLSYASQDAEAAQKICGAFRAAGIEVWFDKSELTGGDVWDRQIREQIHNCRLFIPVISANTEARDEGYFRINGDVLRLVMLISRVGGSRPSTRPRLAW
jgi:TIR domain